MKIKIFFILITLLLYYTFNVYNYQQYNYVNRRKRIYQRHKNVHSNSLLFSKFEKVISKYFQKDDINLLKEYDLIQSKLFDLFDFQSHHSHYNSLIISKDIENFQTIKTLLQNVIVNLIRTKEFIGKEKQYFIDMIQYIEDVFWKTIDKYPLENKLNYIIQPFHDSVF